MLTESLYPRFDWTNGSLSLEQDYHREEVIRRIENFIGAKDKRIAILKYALKHGVKIELDGTPESLEPLQSWFVMQAKEHGGKLDDLSPYILSLVADIALYISDMLFKEHPELFWTINQDRKAVSYLDPVIKGFPNAHPDYCIALWGAVAISVTSALDGRPVRVPLAKLFGKILGRWGQIEK